MVDLYLVLLLIFIIMTTAGVQGVKVNLPKAGQPSKLDGPKMQAITVDNQGNVMLNTSPVTLATLESSSARSRPRRRSFPSSCAATAPPSTRPSWMCSMCSDG